MSGLTTHVLDLRSGLPAGGLVIELFRIGDEMREPLGQFVTNSDGRVDRPLLSESAFKTGAYELVFHAGDYLAGAGNIVDEKDFLDLIPIRFHVTNATRHYHVPLLLSPYGYSTYRGS